MEETIKFIGALVSIFAIYKILADVILARSSRRRDEYEFTKKYIKDLNSNSEHSFVIEQGFHAITGQLCSVEEIRFLLSRKHPFEAVNQRSSVTAFLTFSSSEETYQWNNIYKNPWIQKYAGGWYLFLYSISAFFALFPVYVPDTKVFSNVTIATLSVSLLIAAIFCLNKQINFNTAKKFMKSIERQSAQVASCDLSQ